MMNKPSGAISNASTFVCESIAKAKLSSSSELACTIWISLPSACAASCASFVLMTA